jgi:hypothetical protein
MYGVMGWLARIEIDVDETPAESPLPEESPAP